MTRLFVRVYLSLLLVLVVAMFVLFMGFGFREPDDTAMAAFRDLAEDPSPLTDPFQITATGASGRVATYSVGLPVRYRRMRGDEPIDALDLDRLTAGEAVVGFRPGTGPTLLVPVADGWIAEVASRRSSPVNPMAAAILLLVVGGMAVVYLSLRPFQVQLEQLAMANRRLGRRTWNTRVEMPSLTGAGEVGHAFDEMASRVERLVRGRDRLLEQLTGELVGPASRVSFEVEKIAAQRDPEARETLAAELQADLGAIEALANELHAIPSLEEQPLPRGTEQVDLSPLVAKVVEEANEGLANADVRAPDLDLPRIDADGRLVARALAAVINNAAKHGTGRVMLSSTADDKTLQIHVDDDGPGVPMAERGRIFTTRVAQTDRPDDVGLFVARRICHAHGGRLTVTDGEHGARFTLTLPRI